MGKANMPDTTTAIDTSPYCSVWWDHIPLRLEMQLQLLIVQASPEIWTRPMRIGLSRMMWMRKSI